MARGDGDADRPYDLIIRNGTVIDGSGLPRRRADVGIRDGKVARIAHLADQPAREEIDAAGLIVAPGIVDCHTHYDPQITFDPYATMSCFHGVTTVLAGNCGFSAAPCKREDVDALKAIFARVEDMSAQALAGVRWDEFETFEEFLATRAGRLGVNFACYCGHSNLRLWVMGADANKRAATDAEIEAMAGLLREAMERGAAGLSSSASPTQLDIYDNPIPSRLADEREILALARVVGEYGRGSITFLPYGAMGGLTEEDKALLIAIGQAAGVPVIIQGLGGRNKTDAPSSAWPYAVEFLNRAVAAGAPVYSLLIARPFDRPVIFNETNYHYRGVPSWHRLMALPFDERRPVLRDPAARDELRHAVENYNRDPARGSTLAPPLWNALFIDEVALDRNKPLESQSVADAAAAAGNTPGDFVLDLIDEEDFRTAFRWRTESAEWTDAVREALHDNRMIVGTSDGGAHLARDDGADWSSYFLGTWIRDRGEWNLEEGIRRITDVPASLIGLTDRGRLKVGAPADIMIFDPDTIGIWRKEFVTDLPGGAGRFKAWGKGVKATIVNGEPIVLDGALTGRLPGAVVVPS
jgi:N-acyl-D-aspartate/D-glutamate deacylase